MQANHRSSDLAHMQVTGRYAWLKNGLFACAVLKLLDTQALLTGWLLVLLLCPLQHDDETELQASLMVRSGFMGLSSMQPQQLFSSRLLQCAAHPLLIMRCGLALAWCCRVVISGKFSAGPCFHVLSCSRPPTHPVVSAGNEANLSQQQQALAAAAEAAAAGSTGSSTSEATANPHNNNR